MNHEIKCRGCNAPIPINEGRTVHFCPYCGTTVQTDESEHDFEIRKMQLKEKIRRQKAKELRNSNIYDDLIVLLAVFSPFLFAIILQWLGII